MGCSGCSTGRGTNGLPNGCKSNGGCSTGGCNKLNVFDWLANMQLPSGQEKFDAIEVRFKNGRKEYYKNTENLTLIEGDVVAVESSPGHDIGTVSLTGELVKLQLNKKKVDYKTLLKVYRKAKATDIEKWQEAIDLEQSTMTQARKFAIELKLDMKICDVEYQGDKMKATFYYTADGRVDFRELIKIYASTFKIRVEMRQIGARQEAAKLGGVGVCGRELCCSSWLTDFRSVSTSAARYQQLSLNPQKLAGQCGKLKCCLNFELDSYLDALKHFPDNSIPIETKEGRFYHFKSDIFKQLMWYIHSQDKFIIVAATTKRVAEVQKMNKAGEKPDKLSDIAEVVEEKKEIQYENVVGQDDLTRFDKKKPANKKRRKKKKFEKKDPKP
jgi:cell fate regulator YaaT (PSP1 superfamily)